MAVKISGMMGTGSMGHNNRKFITENVDPARTEQNITLRRENLKQVYHEEKLPEQFRPYVQRARAHIMPEPKHEHRHDRGMSMGGMER